MAVKDHSLDDKIVKAARAEFLEHGYQRASLHKIAARAGLSTGAFYTRYKGKDELFSSLIAPNIMGDGDALQRASDLYREALCERDVDKFLSAIRLEESIYLDALFEHYDDCVLLMCKSEGSSVYTQLKAMLKLKSEDTVNFFKTLSSDGDIDFDALTIIMSEQMEYYRIILERGYDKDKAVSIMRTVETFFEEGWKRLFEQIVSGVRQ